MPTKEVVRNESFNTYTASAVNAVPIAITRSTSRYSFTDTVSGSSLRDYKRRIAKGLQATTTFIADRSTIRSSYGHALYEYMTTPNPLTGYRYRERYGALWVNLGVPTLPLTTHLATAETIAREQFYANYRSAQTSFQGMVALGELRETLTMLRNPARELRRHVGKLYNKILSKKGRVGRTTKMKNKYLSETWLEGSFGWSPLINDVHGALKALSNRRDYIDRNLITISGIGTVTDESVSAGAGYSAGGLSYECLQKQTEETLVRYKGAIACTTETPYEGESRLWGFTPDQIIPTVWELIPYSFLIDYFTNIGKVLDAWSNRTCHLAWGARTERLSAIRRPVDVRSTNSHIGVSSVLQEFFYPGDWVAETKRIHRDPVNTVPIPDFRFRMPGFSTKWLNIAALARVNSSRF